MQSANDSFHFSGRISKFPLGDVLQLLAMSQLMGRLELRCPEPLAQGKIFVEDGMLLDVELVESEAGDSLGFTALERVLAWREGHFTFIQGARPQAARLNQSITNVLLDTHHRADERREILAALPPGSKIIRIDPEPPGVPKLTSEEWQVLALVNGRRSIPRISEKFPDDVKALCLLRALISKGAVTVASPEPERGWQSLLPLPIAAAAVQGERPFPTRLRANLLLKDVDGRKTLGELNQRLAIPPAELLDEVHYLRDLRWIRFSTGDIKRLGDLRSEMAV